MDARCDAMRARVRMRMHMGAFITQVLNLAMAWLLRWLSTGTRLASKGKIIGPAVLISKTSKAEERL